MLEERQYRPAARPHAITKLRDSYRPGRGYQLFHDPDRIRVALLCESDVVAQPNDGATLSQRPNHLGTRSSLLHRFRQRWRGKWLPAKELEQLPGRPV